MLTDSEVLQLENILVRDNRETDCICIADQYIGRGNTNTSNMDGKEGLEYFPLSEFAGKKIAYVDLTELAEGYTSYRVAIAAVVEDMLYLVEKSEKDGTAKTEVTRMRKGWCFWKRIGIAYDTEREYEIILQKLP